MKRLTKRNENGVAVLNVKCPEECEYSTCSMEEGYQCQHQCEGDVINRLTEYEDLEEQGLLLKLPCKVGYIVYVVGTKCLANVITDEDCDDMPGCEMCKYDKEYVVFNRVVDEHFLMDLLYEKNSNFIFGKTVFLTYEEASKKLNEISN